MKLDMKHLGIKSIVVYSDGDPELILTYFTARSKFCKIGFYMGKYDKDEFFGNYCRFNVLSVSALKPCFKTFKYVSSPVVW